MEMHIMNAGGINALWSNLGTWEDGLYTATDECVDNLEELIEQLNEDDPVQQPLRRQLAVSGIIAKDLVPLICDLEDDLGVFKGVIQLLVSLTHPTECQQVNMDITVDSGQEELLPWRLDVERILWEAKVECANEKFIRSLFSNIKTVFDDAGEYDLTEEDSDLINQCLLLLRNILHIQHDSAAVTTAHMYLLKLLFEAGISDIILHILSLQQADSWGVVLTQVLSLLYKDLVGYIFQRLEDSASGGEECCDSDCSECETAMDEHCNITADTDSSEQTSQAGTQPATGVLGQHSAESFTVSQQVCRNHTGCMTLSKSFNTSCRIGCEQMSRSSSSESSGCEVCKNQRPEAFITKQPTDKIPTFEVLGAIVTDFTDKFLQSGFSSLVHILKEILMSKKSSVLDESYFLWTIAFFLKFALRKETPFKFIRNVFTTDVFGFLVYEAASNGEQVLIAHREKKSGALNMRRLHLSVTALRELFKALAFHKGKDLDKEDSLYLQALERDLACMVDLRQLFLWLIRHQIQGCHSNMYLRDVIVTNHYFLLLLEEWINKKYGTGSLDMLQHVKQFATRNVMRHYGDLLQTFQKNDQQLNSCLFTMMHHVAGDCGHAEVLLQVNILKTFLEIWDHEFPVTQEMNDLMEYIIQRFMSSVEQNPLSCAVRLFMDNDTENETNTDLDEDQEEDEDEDSEMSSWTSEEEDKLIQWYSELEGQDRILEKIVQQFTDMGIRKNKLQVVCQLVAIGWLSPEDMDSFGVVEAEDEKKSTNTGSYSRKHSYENHPMKHLLVELSGLEEKQMIPYCLEKIEDKDKVIWLQKSLLELVYIKLDGGQIMKKQIESPIAKFYSAKGLDVPLLSFSDKEESYLQDQYFYVLLQQLGIRTSEETGLILPRIPHFYTYRDLLQKAELLGDFSNVAMKFDPVEVMQLEPSFTQDMPMTSSPYTNVPETKGVERHVKMKMGGLMWMNMVHQFNSSSTSDETKLLSYEDME